MIRLFTAFMLAISILGVSIFEPVASAADKSKETKDISQSVVQSFMSDSSIQTGMIVNIADDDKNNIAITDQKSADSILGVTVAANESPVTITKIEADKTQIFVASSGRFSVLVSNQNGDIKPGDYIVVSALAGIGMKADHRQPLVIGTAVTGFSGNSNVIGSVKLKDSNGSEKSVSLSRVTVNVDISQNPLLTGEKSDAVPGFLANSAQTVADKPVSAARIYLGVVILALAGFVSGVMVYSGVRSGMIAVGRNPLSKKSIFRSLFQTVIAGVTVFIAGVFAVYLLLKL